MEMMRPSNTAAMAEQAASKPVKAKKQGTVLDYLQNDTFKHQLQMALPKFFDTDRFVRSAISDFRLNKALQECTVPSVLGFYMQAAMCGLEPSSVLGQCYPVPFFNKKTGAKECQFIIGYRGMAAIARRSGEVLSIDAQIVHEKDEFDLVYGLEQNLTHRPFLDGDPGPMRGAYCIVRFRDGSYQFKFMSKEEIDNHRRRSKAGSSGPWVTDYEEMARKTVFRSVFKWLPISIEDSLTATRDETVPVYTNNANATNADDLLEVEFVAAEDVETEANNG